MNKGDRTPRYIPPSIEEVEVINKTEVGVVTGGQYLNVRKGPGLNFAPVCRIPDGTVLVIIMETSTEDFYHVCTEDGVNGYCMKKYITIQ